VSKSVKQAISHHLTTAKSSRLHCLRACRRSNRSILLWRRPIRKSFRSPFLISIDLPAPVARNIDTVAPPITVSHSRAPGPATVPATIARIVAVNKLINLFILTPAASATLCGGYVGRADSRNKLTNTRTILRLRFIQPHNTSTNPDCNPVRREYITTSMPGGLNREQRGFG